MNELVNSQITWWATLKTERGPQVTARWSIQPLPVGATSMVDCVWNVMAHAQKPDFVFRRNGRVHLNRRGRQFSRLLAAGVCASMLDTPCSEVVWRVLATHSIRQFPLHSPSRASTCAIIFQLDSTLFHKRFNPRSNDENRLEPASLSSTHVSGENNARAKWYSCNTYHVCV